MSDSTQHLDELHVEAFWQREVASHSWQDAITNILRRWPNMPRSTVEAALEAVESASLAELTQMHQKVEAA